MNLTNKLKINCSKCKFHTSIPHDIGLTDYCLEKGLISGDQIKSCSDSFYDGSNLNIPDKDKIPNCMKIQNEITDAIAKIPASIEFDFIFLSTLKSDDIPNKIAPIRNIISIVAKITGNNNESVSSK